MTETELKPCPDYTLLKDGDLLRELGTDALKWAEAFLQHLHKYDKPPYDVGYILTWFANAMMAQHDRVTRAEASKPPQAVSEVLEHLDFLDRNIGDWCEKDASDVVKLARDALTSHAALSARVAELEAAAQWQPIEKAPKDKLVWVWSPQYGRQLAELYPNGKWLNHAGGRDLSPTMFMLLPEPPTPSPDAATSEQKDTN